MDFLTEFVGGIVVLITQLFGALIDVLASLGALVFNINTETGAITGVAPFGWLTVIMVGIPLATWAFNKSMGLFNKIFKK